MWSWHLSVILSLFIVESRQRRQTSSLIVSFLSLGNWFQGVKWIGCSLLSSWRKSLVLLHSSLLLVVVVEVAVLTFALGVHQPIRVCASICKTVSSVLVVAVVAHTLSENDAIKFGYLGIVFLIFVRAFHNLHGSSLVGEVGRRIWFLGLVLNVFGSDDDLGGWCDSSEWLALILFYHIIFSGGLGLRVTS